MAQVKKPEVRRALLLAAKQEFLERGFKLSSMRRIAATAGTTIGNLYKYFESKEAIYEELVSRVKGDLWSFISNAENKLPTDPILQLQLFVTLVSSYRDDILLLVDASDGTEYQNTYEDLLAMISDNLETHLPDFNMDNGKEAGGSVILVRTLSVGLLSGIIDILRNHSEEDEIKKGLTLYFTYIFKSFL
ncbi:TetR/AcrR family transcriptional regulator [Metabacillus endolithicus]|uniref:TetR/AcrR family transcriptional regulator n=1 Tax=Metabacillus endolithicus TaxID=1535204 RepID=A0ABW5C0P5_9BACI|nr:TetR/AcrR family transcriptional regulator [Metabacillus endolithicus]UPG65739.1 TetR/AcrR family transcriptional regulator [Metabacillus endolithicus]